jgi:hypothetical protein
VLDRHKVYPPDLITDIYGVPCAYTVFSTCWYIFYTYFSSAQLLYCKMAVYLTSRRSIMQNKWAYTSKYTGPGWNHTSPYFCYDDCRLPPRSPTARTPGPASWMVVCLSNGIPWKHSHLDVRRFYGLAVIDECTKELRSLVNRAQWSESHFRFMFDFQLIVPQTFVPHRVICIHIKRFYQKSINLHIFIYRDVHVGYAAYT